MWPLWVGLIAQSGAEEPEVIRPVPSDPHYDLERLYAEGQFEEGLSRASVRARSMLDDPVLLWQTARFRFEIGEHRADDPEFDRLAWFKETLEVAKRAAQLAPEDPHTRFWRGVLQTKVGALKGGLRNVFTANAARQDLEFAAQHPTFRYESLNRYQQLPCDAIHELGVFYRLAPDRALARTLTGTRGGLDQSLAYHEVAVRCAPTSVQATNELGMTQVCLARQRGEERMLQLGLRTLNQAMSMPFRTPKDAVDQRHANQVLANPDLACSYSRESLQLREEGRPQVVDGP